MTTVSSGTDANRSASRPATPNGIDRTMTSRPWTAASARSAARAPDSSTSARTASGPRASATWTS